MNRKIVVIYIVGMFLLINTLTISIVGMKTDTAKIDIFKESTNQESVSQSNAWVDFTIVVNWDDPYIEVNGSFPPTWSVNQNPLKIDCSRTLQAWVSWEQKIEGEWETRFYDSQDNELWMDAVPFEAYQVEENDPWYVEVINKPPDIDWYLKAGKNTITAKGSADWLEYEWDDLYNEWYYVDWGELHQTERWEIDVFKSKDDSYIGFQTSNYSTGDLINLAVRNMYGYTSEWECDTLIRFDLSSIQSEDNVASAKLYLYYYEGQYNPAGRELTCHRITSYWDEDSVTYNTKPIISANVTDSSVVPSFYGWMEWDVTNDVKDFICEQTDNYGWQIMDEEYWGYPNVPLTNFYSKEYSNSSYHPYLEVVAIDQTLNTTSNTDSSNHAKDLFLVSSVFFNLIHKFPLLVNILNIR